MIRKYIINNLQEMKDFATELSTFITSSNIGNFIGLIGNLGSGKTQFTKFFAESLGCLMDDVTSPTFAILNEYDCQSNKIYHFDLYRLNSVEELEEIGYKDFLYANGISIVEWVDKIPSAIPYFGIILKFEVFGQVREVTFFESKEYLGGHF